jgi:2-dehydropantoate 2-reductase
VGGLIGVGLASSGEAVTVVVRPDAVEEYPRSLSLNSDVFGTFTVPVSVTSKLFQAVDVLWIAVKATDLHTALESVPTADQVGAVVPLLNGIDHVALLRDRFGRDKVVPATIGVSTERVAPGRIIWHSPFAKLSLSSAGRKSLRATVEELSRFGFECHFIDDETTLMWSKLVFLAPHALSTTAADAPIGKVMSDPGHAAELRGLVVEACAVAVASGARVDTNDVWEQFKNLPADTRSSMQRDVEQGKIPEVDAIAGPILRGAEVFSIPVPTTRRVVQQILRQSTRASASNI